MKLTQEQNQVKNLVVKSLTHRKSCCLTGAAGTGKTTTLRFILNELEHRFKVSAVSPTHQACAVLRSTIDRPVATIASLLKKKKEIDKDTGLVSFNPQNFKNNKSGIIIIDESSMLEPKDVLTFSENYPNATFLFVGDKYQLPPIEHQDFNIFEYFPTFELITNMRCGHGNQMFDLIENVRRGNLNIEFGGNVLKVHQDDIDGQIPIIVYTNSQRKYWNNLILQRITGGEINSTVKFIANDNINYDKKLGLYDIKNGETFYPTNVQIQTFKTTDFGFETEYYQLEALIDNRKVSFKFLNEPDRLRYERYLERFKGIDWLMYYRMKNIFPDIDLAYSITSHKSQGSTFSESIVDVQDIGKIQNLKLRNASLYVALSRNKDRVYIL